MLRLLLLSVGVAARTALGLLAIVLGIGFISLGIILVSQSTLTCQFFALGALTAIVLYIAHQLGGFLWRLLD
jgi:hypothetical protein